MQHNQKELKQQHDRKIYSAIRRGNLFKMFQGMDMPVKGMTTIYGA